MHITAYCESSTRLSEAHNHFHIRTYQLSSRPFLGV